MASFDPFASAVPAKYDFLVDAADFGVQSKRRIELEGDNGEELTPPALSGAVQNALGLVLKPAEYYLEVRYCAHNGRNTSLVNLSMCHSRVLEASSARACLIETVYAGLGQRVRGMGVVHISITARGWLLQWHED